MTPEVKNGKIIPGESTKSEVSFHSVDQDLISLEGSPENVAKKYSVLHSPRLKSLIGAPKIVGGDFTVTGCGLASLEGIPKEVGSEVSLFRNKLTSLKGIRALKKMNGLIDCRGNDIDSNILGVLHIDGCTELLLNGSAERYKAAKIVNEFLKKPFTPHRLYECQDALIDAGLEDFAEV